MYPFKKFYRFLIIAFVCCFTLSFMAGCHSPFRKMQKEDVQTAVNKDSDANQAKADTKDSDTITRNTLVIDYIYYSEDPNSTYDIPETFTRNGKTYTFSGDAEYLVSEAQEGIAFYDEVNLQEQEELNNTFLFTSPETGLSYSLPKSTVRFSEEIPVEITLHALSNFGPSKEKPIIPESKEIEYYNKITKQDEIVLAPLTATSVSPSYWLESDEPIYGTFYTDSYDSRLWTIGWEVDESNSDENHTEYIPRKIPLDFKYKETPSWDGYEEDIIKWLNLDPSFYRVTAAGWVGEIYEKLEHQEDWNRDIVVWYRDAVYPYEVFVQDYSAVYETSVETLGYQAKVWYFSSKDEILKNAENKGRKYPEDKLARDIKTLYEITVTVSYYYEEKTTDSLSNQSDKSTPLSAPPFENDEQNRLADLKDKNSDVIGIIRIPDTVLDHPLMQCAEDEDFYLRRDLDGKDDKSGLPFLTLDSSLNAPCCNSIIYGHNIHKNKKDVFCDLAEYENLEYYKQHPILEIITEEGLSEYIIFAYYLIDTSDADDNFAYFNTASFLSVKHFQSYIKEVRKRNWLNVPITLTRSDSYITLSSCSRELSGTKSNRMVVMARKIRENEDVSAVIEKAEKVDNPLLPCKLRSSGSATIEREIVCSNNPENQNRPLK